MTGELVGAIAAYGVGVLTGLYLGFKLWRQQYVNVSLDHVRRKLSY